MPAGKPPFVRRALPFAIILVLGSLAAAPAATAAIPAQATWHFPEAAYVGHPIHISATIHDERTLTDEILDVRLHNREVLRAYPLLGHGGAYPFVFTPPRAGTVTVAFNDAEMVDFVGEPTAGDPKRYVERDTIAVLPALEPTSDLPLELWSRTPAEVYDQDQGQTGAIGVLIQGRHDTRMQMHFDIRDSAGRLGKSVLSGANHAAFVQWDIGSTSGAMLGYVLPSGAHPDAVLTQTVAHAWDGQAAPAPQFSNPPSAFDDCDGRVVVGTPSLAPDGFAWIAGSTIRVQTASPGEAAVYRLHSLTPAAARLAWQYERSYDPFHVLAFAAPPPGMYELGVHTGDIDCHVRFTTLPSTAQGTARVGLTTHGSDDGNVTITIQALVDDRPHADYAFDTRVFRLPAGARPGELVWMGTLRGDLAGSHIELFDLAPGDYEVRTYPSPLTLEAPLAATADPEGFRTTFYVPWSLEDDAIVSDEFVTQPGPGPLVLVGILGLLILALRRRSGHVN